jgi:hypothetical protein
VKYRWEVTVGSTGWKHIASDTHYSSRMETIIVQADLPRYSPRPVSSRSANTKYPRTDPSRTARPECNGWNCAPSGTYSVERLKPNSGGIPPLKSSNPPLSNPPPPASPASARCPSISCTRLSSPTPDRAPNRSLATRSRPDSCGVTIRACTPSSRPTLCARGIRPRPCSDLDR